MSKYCQGREWWKERIWLVMYAFPLAMCWLWLSVRVPGSPGSGSEIEVRTLDPGHNQAVTDGMGRELMSL